MDGDEWRVDNLERADDRFTGSEFVFFEQIDSASTRFLFLANCHPPLTTGPSP